MEHSPESPRGEPENAVDMLLSAVARLESKIEARGTPMPEKQLKSSRLNVQHELISDWISRLNRVNSEDPVLTGVIEDMKARNLLLRKADVKPEFFVFFDNYREAEPDMPFAQCVSEALKKFNELEATRPRGAASYSGRKRPFRPSGTSGGRAGVAYNRESGLVQQLSQQVYAIQQQLNSQGFTGAAPRNQRPAGPPFCFFCKGFGHYARQCPQGSASRQ